MIHLAWPWMALLLPLPWLVGRLVPPARPQGGALFLPFAATVSADWTPGLRANSRWRVLLFALVWVLLVGAAMRPRWVGEPLAAWLRDRWEPGSGVGFRYDVFGTSRDDLRVVRAKP